MSLGAAYPWRKSPALAAAAGSLATPRAKAMFRPLALAAVIPLMLFGAAAAFLEAEAQRSLARAEAGNTLERVADRVTVALQNEVEIAKALAAMPSLDRPDLDRFYRTAQRIAPKRPLWETVSIVDTRGEQTMNILRQLGDPLGPVSDRAGFEQAIATQKPAIGGLGPVGPVSGKRLVSISVPIIRDGDVLNVLVVGLSPSEIERILLNAGAPESWIGSIVDANGNLIASGGQKTGRGSQAELAVRAAVATQPSGEYTGRTSTGAEVETLYKRLDATNGWTVHFSIRSAKLNGPVSRSTLLLAASCGLCLLLAASLAHTISRDLEQRRRESERLSALTLESVRASLLKRLTQAQENEQRRIARELHDQVGQSLAGLSLGLKGLEGKVEDAALRERLVWLESLTADVSRDIHRVAADLRPAALDDLGLVRALSALAADLSLRHDVFFDVQAIGLEGRLDPEIENNVFRVVQEAFTNVLKHAEATQASAILERRGKHLRIVIEDDGRGLAERPSPSGDRWGAHLGLSNIEERLATLGGSMRVETEQGRGFGLFIKIPLAAEGAAA